ncbi:MAG: FG-GAP-like repeat-containing protein [Candidatus Limnocylindrus sp.]
MLANAALAQSQVVGWGNNQHGQVDPGTSSVIPYRSVAGGSEHVVALKADGTVACWGKNVSGQATTPAGLSGVTQVDGGSNQTIVLKSNGAVLCWGDNYYGQSAVPPDLAPSRAVASGENFSMALSVEGIVRCWGENAYGQCNVPSDIGVVRAIDAGGFHGMALTAAGTVRCWGAGQTQSGGFYDKGQSIVPVGLVDVTSIAAGGTHSVALRSDGTVAAWGLTYGSVPPGLDSVRQVAAGWGHSLALNNDGTVQAWGDNLFGSCDVPSDLANVIQVAAGGVSSYALRTDGSVVGWGRVALPAPATLYDVTSVAIGEFHVAALRPGGTVICWGNNASGEATPPAGLSGVTKLAASYFTVALKGDGSIVTWGAYAPQTPSGLGPLIDVSAGSFHVSAVLANGTTACWGDNNFGQLNMPSLTGVANIDAGNDHSIARHSNGTVTCWGRNNAGQCNTPAGLSQVTQVSGGYLFSLALRSDGTVRSWGYFGQSWVQNLSSVTQVAAGGFNAIALKSDGQVECWGLNNFGALDVPPGLAPVTQVDAGSYNHLVLLAQSAASCGNPAGSGTATLARSGSVWQDVPVWSWSNGGGPQTPGALTDVDLGTFLSVGSLCDAQCRSLVMRSGSTVIVTADLGDPSSWDDHVITVSETATMAGRVWLIGSGASVLPDNLNIPVLVAGDPQGIFDVIQSTVPPPPGKFLALVASESLGGGATYSLQLLSLPVAASLVDGQTSSYAGTAVAAEAMDWNGDGFDDLALAIDFGTSQAGRLQVLLNDGEGNLGNVESVQVQTPSQPQCLAVGDVNLDGKIDAVVCIGSNDTGQIYLNAYSAGTQGDPFVEGATLAVGGDPLSAVVIPPAAGASLAEAGPGGPGVGVGSGGSSGSGGSGPSVKVFNPANGVQVQNVPTGGAPGVLVRRGRQLGTGGNSATTVGGSGLPGFVALLSLDAQGNYVVTQEVEVPGVPVHMDSADIDGDGYEDLVSANAEPVQQGSGTPLPVLTLFRGGPEQVSQAVPIAPDGATAGLDVSLIDADGDGDRDIVSVHESIAGRSSASLVQIDTPGPGSPLTIGSQTDIDSTRPVLCTRGDLDQSGGEDLFLVDRGITGLSLAGGGGASAAIPLTGLNESSTCASDINGDGTVEGKDLATLLAQWGSVGTADLDDSGSVDGVDLAILLTNWGSCP